MRKKSLASPKEIQIPEELRYTLSEQGSDLNSKDKKEGEEPKMDTIHSSCLFLITFFYLPFFAVFFLPTFLLSAFYFGFVLF